MARSSAPAALAIARLGCAELIGEGGFALTSVAFEDGEELDPCFTADEEDAVAPPLDWTAPPSDAVEIVLVVEDADAAGGPACHWLVWGLAAQRGKLMEGEIPPRVGKNARRNSEWLAPAPPHEDDPHAYLFQMFAVDRPVGLAPGATREDVIAAIDGHVVAAAILTGRYARIDEDDWADDAEDDA